MTVPTGSPLPESVRILVARYLQLADEALPGRIEGLYLVGSLALNDYREGTSDVDFVAVTGSRLSPDEMTHLDAIHRTLLTDLARPWFDGIYVTWEDLTHNPDEARTVPHSQEGRFDRERGFEANPATWRILRNHAMTVRGSATHIWFDAHVLRSWMLANLSSYWADMATQLENAASRLTGEDVSRAVVWCVSGVLRLAYTLETADVTSKSGACRHALSRYPARWHPIVLDALAIRSGQPQHGTRSATPIEDTIAFMRYVTQRENAR